MSTKLCRGKGGNLGLCFVMIKKRLLRRELEGDTWEQRYENMIRYGDGRGWEIWNSVLLSGRINFMGQVASGHSVPLSAREAGLLSAQQDKNQCQLLHSYSFLQNYNIRTIAIPTCFLLPPLIFRWTREGSVWYICLIWSLAGLKPLGPLHLWRGGASSRWGHFLETKAGWERLPLISISTSGNSASV